MEKRILSPGAIAARWRRGLLAARGPRCRRATQEAGGPPWNAAGIKFQRSRRQPVVSTEAGHPLRVHRSQGRKADTRRRHRHAPDQDDRRRPLRRRRRQALPRAAASSERTTDWYSQDSRGNVWYFGENTAELDAHGHVTSTAGTWMAGVNGARAGHLHARAILALGQIGRQELLQGSSRGPLQGDRALRQRHAAGIKNTLLTQETTPLEPGTVDHKMYVRGIGTVLEQTQKGGDERNELVSVTRTA